MIRQMHTTPNGSLVYRVGMYRYEPPCALPEQFKVGDTVYVPHLNTLLEGKILSVHRAFDFMTGGIHYQQPHGVVWYETAYEIQFEDRVQSLRESQLLEHNYVAPDMSLMVAFMDGRYDALAPIMQQIEPVEDMPVLPIDSPKSGFHLYKDVPQSFEPDETLGFIDGKAFRSFFDLLGSDSPLSPLATCIEAWQHTPSGSIVIYELGRDIDRPTVIEKVDIAYQTTMIELLEHWVKTDNIDGDYVEFIRKDLA